MDIVDKIRTGDQRAFEQLYDDYSAALYGLVFSIVKSEGAAEDITQDVFVKIWKNIGSYDKKKGSLFTWMLNIARNASIDALRKNKKIVLVENQNIDSGVSIGNYPKTTVKIAHIGIAELVAKLSSDDQLVVEYLYFKGYTQQELADELEIPLGTVKTRSRRALKELIKLFNLLAIWM